MDRTNNRSHRTLNALGIIAILVLLTGVAQAGYGADDLTAELSTEKVGRSDDFTITGMPQGQSTWRF